MTAPKFLLASANGPAREFVLQPGVNTFGRRATNQHVIDHPSVSGCHCEIVWENETLLVRDLGSTNHTFVDGQRMEQGVLGPKPGVSPHF
jgi:pSer/pThr/pTyr-binding forkhead associated (FHA) protein